MTTQKLKPLKRLNVFSFKGLQMRIFHITWLTFFVCFFGWFGLAPLMPAIRADLGLTKAEVGNTIIAAVSATIFAQLIIGKLLTVVDLLENVKKLHQILALESIRLTGGEPLLYPHLERLIAGLKEIGIPRIKMTTNGFLLEKKQKH